MPRLNAILSTQQESVRLAALLANSLIIKQEKRFLRTHVSVALLSQRLLLKKSSNLSSHDLSKLLANKTKWWNCCKKKVLPFTQFFVLLIAKSVVAKNEEEYCADSFKTNGFPQSLSPPLCQTKLQWSCFPTLHFNIFFKKPISRLAESLSNKKLLRIARIFKKYCYRKGRLI